MFYMHSGKVYAPRMKNGATVYDTVCVQPGKDGAPCIVKAKGSAKTLPSGAIPMTRSEVLARVPCETQSEDKKGASECI